MIRLNIWIIVFIYVVSSGAVPGNRRYILDNNHNGRRSEKPYDPSLQPNTQRRVENLKTNKKPLIAVLIDSSNQKRGKTIVKSQNRFRNGHQGRPIVRYDAEAQASYQYIDGKDRRRCARPSARVSRGFENNFQKPMQLKPSNVYSDSAFRVPSYLPNPQYLNTNSRTDRNGFVNKYPGTVHRQLDSTIRRFPNPIRRFYPEIISPTFRSMDDQEINDSPSLGPLSYRSPTEMYEGFKGTKSMSIHPQDYNRNRPETSINLDNNIYRIAIHTPESGYGSSDKTKNYNVPNNYRRINRPSEITMNINSTPLRYREHTGTRSEIGKQLNNFIIDKVKTHDFSPSSITSDPIGNSDFNNSGVLDKVEDISKQNVLDNNNPLNKTDNSYATVESNSDGEKKDNITSYDTIYGRRIQKQSGVRTQMPRNQEALPFNGNFNPISNDQINKYSSNIVDWKEQRIKENHRDASFSAKDLENNGTILNYKSSGLIQDQFAPPYEDDNFINDQKEVILQVNGIVDSAHYDKNAVAKLDSFGDRYESIIPDNQRKREYSSLELDLGATRNPEHTDNHLKDYVPTEFVDGQYVHFIEGATKERKLLNLTAEERARSATIRNDSLNNFPKIGFVEGQYVPIVSGNEKTEPYLRAYSSARDAKDAEYIDDQLKNYFPREFIDGQYVKTVEGDIEDRKIPKRLDVTGEELARNAKIDSDVKNNFSELEFVDGQYVPIISGNQKTKPYLRSYSSVKDTKDVEDINADLINYKPREFIDGQYVQIVEGSAKERKLPEILDMTLEEPARSAEISSNSDNNFPKLDLVKGQYVPKVPSNPKTVPYLRANLGMKDDKDKNKYDVQVTNYKPREFIDGQHVQTVEGFTKENMLLHDIVKGSTELSRTAGIDNNPQNLVDFVDNNNVPVFEGKNELSQPSVPGRFSRNFDSSDNSRNTGTLDFEDTDNYNGSPVANEPANFEEKVSVPQINDMKSSYRNLIPNITFANDNDAQAEESNQRRNKSVQNEFENVKNEIVPVSINNTQSEPMDDPDLLIFQGQFRNTNPLIAQNSHLSNNETLKKLKIGLRETTNSEINDTKLKGDHEPQNNSGGSIILNSKNKDIGLMNYRKKIKNIAEQDSTTESFSSKPLTNIFDREDIIYKQKNSSILNTNNINNRNLKLTNASRDHTSSILRQENNTSNNQSNLNQEQTFKQNDHNYLNNKEFNSETVPDHHIMSINMDINQKLLSSLRLNGAKTANTELHKNSTNPENSASIEIKDVITSTTIPITTTEYTSKQNVSLTKSHVMSVPVTRIKKVKTGLHSELKNSGSMILLNNPSSNFTQQDGQVNQENINKKYNHALNQSVFKPKVTNNSSDDTFGGINTDKLKEVHRESPEITETKKVFSIINSSTLDPFMYDEKNENKSLITREASEISVDLGDSKYLIKNVSGIGANNSTVSIKTATEEAKDTIAYINQYLTNGVEDVTTSYGVYVTEKAINLNSTQQNNITPFPSFISDKNLTPTIHTKADFIKHDLVTEISLSNRSQHSDMINSEERINIPEEFPKLKNISSSEIIDNKINTVNKPEHIIKDMSVDIVPDYSRSESLKENFIKAVNNDEDDVSLSDYLKQYNRDMKEHENKNESDETSTDFVSGIHRTSSNKEIYPTGMDFNHENPITSNEVQDSDFRIITNLSINDINANVRMAEKSKMSDDIIVTDNISALSHMTDKQNRLPRNHEQATLGSAISLKSTASILPLINCSDPVCQDVSLQLFKSPGKNKINKLCFDVLDPDKISPDELLLLIKDKVIPLVLSESSLTKLQNTTVNNISNSGNDFLAAEDLQNSTEVPLSTRNEKTKDVTQPQISVSEDVKIDDGSLDQRSTRKARASQKRNASNKRMCGRNRCLDFYARRKQIALSTLEAARELALDPQL